SDIHHRLSYHDPRNRRHARYSTSTRSDIPGGRNGRSVHRPIPGSEKHGVTRRCGVYRSPNTSILPRITATAVATTVRRAVRRRPVDAVADRNRERLAFG